MKLFRRWKGGRLDKIDSLLVEADGTVALLLGHDGTRPVDYLQDRVQAYVSFALDGQMVEMYPETAGRPVRLYLVFEQELTPEVATYVEDVRPRLGRYGIDLAIRVPGQQ